MTTEDLWIATPQGRLYARRWNVTPAHTDPVPFVLFHDSLGCVALWRDFPEQLAQATQRPVIAYDRLGFGQSDPHPGRLTPQFVREESRQSFPALRAQLGLGRFIALGHSVGGGMAVGVAAETGADCLGLITESAQTFVEDRTREGIRAAEASFAQPGQIERLRRYHGDKAEWVLRAWIDTWLSPTFADWSLDADLREVRCPVLALHGELDEFGSAAHPQRIAAGVQGPARARLLEGCGHVPHREQSGTVLQEITGWLRGVVTH